MAGKVKQFFNFIKEHINPVSIAVAVTLVIVIAGTVFFFVKKRSKPADIPLQIVAFDDEDIQMQVISFSDDEENSVYDEAEASDLIRNAEKNKVVSSSSILPYKEDGGRGYLNNCCFLGDSRTVGMKNFKFISDEDGLAKVGLMHIDALKTTFTQNSGKKYTIKDYLKARQAQVIYVGYGVNGIDSISDERYKTSYTEIVEKLIEWAPESDIVLMSIWPVDDNGVYQGKVKNEWIDKYNDFLLELAEEKDIYYLDVNTVLKNENGSIVSAYDSGDGLHYSTKGYGVIFDYIVTHPVPGVSDEGEYKVHYVKPPAQNTIPAAPAKTPAVTAAPEIPTVPEAPAIPENPEDLLKDIPPELLSGAPEEPQDNSEEQPEEQPHEEQPEEQPPEENNEPPAEPEPEPAPEGEGENQDG